MHALLGKSDVKITPHEAIIHNLDAAGQLFNVLILKTTLRIPYTSIFLELECGYWNADAEKRLRKGSPQRKTSLVIDH